VSGGRWRATLCLKPHTAYLGGHEYVASQSIASGAPMAFLNRALVGVLLTALTLGALAWAGATVWRAVDASLADVPDAREAREAVVSAPVMRVVSGTAHPVIESFGEVRSVRTLDIRAAAPGRIVELSESFRDGGEVAPGEVLVRIDPAQAQADRDLASADLDEARAEERDAARARELAEADLAVAREQAALRAQALARQRDLDGRGVGSVATVEEAALAAAAARATVVSRQQALATAEARIDQAASRVTRAKIALAEAERRLADSEIRAPFAGRLSDVSVVEGGLVALNEPLAQLVDPGALEVAFRLPVVQYSRILDDDGRLVRRSVRVSQDVAGLDMVATGMVVRESPRVGEGQTGRGLYARLDEAGGFRPGDIVTVRIAEPPLDRVASLPARAVASDGSVLVVGDDDRLHEVRVEVLRRQGDRVLVRAPDLEGDRIVSERAPALGAGIRIRPEETGAPSRPDDVRAQKTGTMRLSPERRAQLIARVENDASIDARDKSRVLAILERPDVPTQVVERIEGRVDG